MNSNHLRGKIWQAVQFGIDNKPAEANAIIEGIISDLSQSPRLVEVKGNPFTKVEGMMVPFVKEIRERSGLGLKEAKDIWESGVLPVSLTSSEMLAWLRKNGMIP
jgi:hypothetical protein